MTFFIWRHINNFSSKIPQAIQIHLNYVCFSQENQKGMKNTVIKTFDFFHTCFRIINNLLSLDFGLLHFNVAWKICTFHITMLAIPFSIKHTFMAYYYLPVVKDKRKKWHMSSRQSSTAGSRHENEIDNVFVTVSYGHHFNGAKVKSVKGYRYSVAVPLRITFIRKQKIIIFNLPLLGFSLLCK